MTRKISYIDLINRFWTVQERAGLCASDIALYFLLLREANRRRWPESMQYSNRDLSAHSGLSEDTIARSRKRLKEAGLIDYTAPKHGIAPLYSLLLEKPHRAESHAESRAECCAESYNKDIKTKDNNNPFVFPLLEEVEAYIEEYSQRSGRQPEFTAERWMAYYQSNGWRVGRNPMKDWRAAVRTWFTQQNNSGNGNQQISKSANQQMANSHSPSSAEQARLERERDAASIIARLAAQNRLD